MTPKRLRSRFFTAGGLAVVVLLGSGALEARRTDAPSAALHVLNRLAFGPRPGDVERVEQMGVSAYIEQQLHPERLPDDALNARIATFETVSLSSKELTEKFALDFTALKLGRPHHMLFGSSKLGKGNLAKAD